MASEHVHMTPVKIVRNNACATEQSYNVMLFTATGQM